jgi:hypothetical protein
MQKYKVYKKGNYIYFEYTDSAGKVIKKRYSALELTYSKEELFFNVYHKTKGSLLNLEFASSSDEAGATYTEAQLENFLNENTGFNTAPGGSGAGVTSVSGKTGVVTLTKNDVGLANVDNTSDANKPVSLATQTALDSKVPSALLGVISGIATLGADSKLLTSQIPDSIIAGLKWQGTWNVATNTPDVPSALALNNGFFYKVNVVGTSSITGSSITYSLGDWLISNGTVWQHVPNVNTVNSFKGRVGDVIPSTGDYNQKQIKTIHDNTLVEGWFGVDNTGIYFETV